MLAKSLGPKAITYIINLGTDFTSIKEKKKRVLFIQCTALQFVMGFNQKDNRCRIINSKKDALGNRETIALIPAIFVKS